MSRVHSAFCLLPWGWVGNEDVQLPLAGGAAPPSSILLLPGDAGQGETSCTSQLRPQRQGQGRDSSSCTPCAARRVLLRPRASLDTPILLSWLLLGFSSALNPLLRAQLSFSRHSSDSLRKLPLLGSREFLQELKIPPGHLRAQQQ